MKTFYIIHSGGGMFLNLDKQNDKTKWTTEAARATFFNTLNDAQDAFNKVFPLATTCRVWEVKENIIDKNP